LPAPPVNEQCGVAPVEIVIDADCVFSHIACVVRAARSSAGMRAFKDAPAFAWVSR
jgi:hypothetical protein